MTDDYLQIQYIQAHAGHPGNEIADLLAKAVCGMHEPGRLPNVSVAKWMHGNPPLIEWSWTMVDNLHRDGQVPRYEHGHYRWTMWKPPDPDLQWLPSIPLPKQCSDVALQLHLTFVTYNVGSLKEAAKSAYLRQQMQFFNIAIAGLQETRVSYDDVPDSNYMRFIAKSDQGVGGCELWVATGIPYNGSDQKIRFFQRKMFQVILASSQLLLVACDLEDQKLLFAVGHAPHQGRGKDVVRDWWSHLSKCLDEHSRSRHIIILIDANAQPETHPPNVGDLGDHDSNETARCFLELLQHHALFLPATFSDLHQGPQHTWCSNDAQYKARLDYVAIPLHWCRVISH